MSNLFEKPAGVQTRWFSPENERGERSRGGLANGGAKGRPYLRLPAGATTTLMDFEGSGTVTRFWATIDDRSPEMLRSLRLEMFWDGAETPAVSVPFGDFFGIGLGERTAFECALFSDPEGRSFNCFIPMPFQKGARITLTNQSGKDLRHLFYDVDALVNVDHAPDTLYFHAVWRREKPNPLGQDYTIVPKITQNGRFLGCNLGVIVDPRYEGAWFGEGEVKMRFGGEETPTLCGTGTEDYIGTAWGQGAYVNRTQGSPIADGERGYYAFYRYHVDDPVYFDNGLEVTIQTIGGCEREKVVQLRDGDVPLTPTTLDFGDERGMIHLVDAAPGMAVESFPEDKGWSNFYRQDDWSSTAYLYLNSAAGVFPPLVVVNVRLE
jgi:hypothetical protein